MDTEYLQAGKIVNTHGLRGEIKLQPWADSPEFITSLKTLYIDDIPKKILSAKVHKNHVIILFEGVNDVDAAVLLKNKTVMIKRSDAPLPEGSYYVADIFGLTAYDDATGEKLGTVTDVMTLPANDVYVITGTREILVPAVPDFISSIDVNGGSIRIRLIEGM